MDGTTDLEKEIWAALGSVTDPELDESVTELGFVKHISVEGGEVHIQFHLPTFWCAANFAFMMASDMHEAASRVIWVKSVKVELIEHMYADTINRGISDNSSFKDTFGDEANGEIDSVRELFRKKAFQQRQELMLRQLMEQSFSPARLINMTMAELQQYQSQSDAQERVRQRYLEIRHEWGGAVDASQAAFVSVDGERLSESGFEDYLQQLRRTRINTQFNGEICKGLLHARYGTDRTEQAPAGEADNATEMKLRYVPIAAIQST